MRSGGQWSGIDYLTPRISLRSPFARAAQLYHYFYESHFNSASLGTHTHQFTVLDDERLLSLGQSGSERRQAVKLQHLDMDAPHNLPFMKYQEEKTSNSTLINAVTKWIIAMLIAVIISCSVAFMKVAFHYWNSIIVFKWCGPTFSWSGGLAFTLLNAACAITATALCHSTHSGQGSGEPELKCYLNGVYPSDMFSWKCFLTKTFGSILSVNSHLPVDAILPQLFTSACVAIRTISGRASVLKSLQTDRKRSTIVCIGLACGVSGVLAAPIGGVLWVMETACMTYEHSTVWQMYFAALVVTFTVNGISVLLSYGGVPRFTALYEVGSFLSVQEDQTSRIFELPFFFLLGVMGGLSGAATTALHTFFYRASRHYSHTTLKAAGVTLTVAFSFYGTAYLVSYIHPSCKRISDVRTNDRKNLTPQQFLVGYCGTGMFSETASLFFNTGQSTFQQLYHYTNSFSTVTLALLAVAYYLFSAIHPLLILPSGFYISHIILGACVGSLVGFTSLNLGNNAQIDPGVYALIGSASFLNGMVRSPISFTVIFIESTNDVTFALPLILSMTIAKWVADLFNKSSNDSQIFINRLPYLTLCYSDEFGASTCHLRVHDVMTRDPIMFPIYTTVREVVCTLKHSDCNAFPVLHHPEVGKKVDGIIMREELLLILYHRQFFAISELRDNMEVMDYEKFSTFFPSVPSWKDITLEHSDMEKVISLSGYMNCMPFTVEEQWSAVKVYTLFRTLGLRHALVKDYNGRITGILTRHNLISLSESKQREEQFISWCMRRRSLTINPEREGLLNTRNVRSQVRQEPRKQ